MREKIGKILTWRPGKGLVAAGAVLALAALLLPLFRIIPYTSPWYDDYNYGKFVKGFLDQERSLGSALQGAAYCVKTQWYAWQGTFSSIFLMALVPLVWGEQYYFTGPLFLLVILLVSLLLLSKVLLRDVLGAEWPFCLTVHYVGMHSFLLLLTAAWIKLLKGAGKISRVLLVIWIVLGAVLAGGANFVTALQGLLIGLSLTALGILLKSRRTLLLLPSLAVYAVSFGFNVGAPGNDVRKNVLSGYGMGPLEAIGNSFLEAFRRIPEFTGLITAAVLVLLVPGFYAQPAFPGTRRAGKDDERSEDYLPAAAPYQLGVWAGLAAKTPEGKGQAF